MTYPPDSVCRPSHHYVISAVLRDNTESMEASASESAKTAPTNHQPRKRLSPLDLADKYLNSPIFFIPNVVQLGAMVTAVNVPTKAERRLKILIADDNEGVRKMVRTILDTQPRFQVCVEVPDGAKAIEEARRLKPDVVVLDWNMPVMNGFEAARELKVILPKTAIVILSSYIDAPFVEEAKKIGVNAYVAKTEAREQLVTAIDTAVSGSEAILLEYRRGRR